MALQRVTLPIGGTQLGESLIIPEDQLHYLQRVLRLGSGDKFIAMSGRGERWLAQIVGCEAVLIELLTESRELPQEIYLGVAMPKLAGMESIIRQTTELGVHRIIPLTSHRSLLQPSSNKLDRWRKIAQESAELACRSIVPQIDAPITLKEFLSLDPDRFRLIGSTAPDTMPLLELLHHNDNPITILTGPEGGWSDQETQIATDRGWKAMSLARGVLAATTAPVAALSVVNAYLSLSQNQNLLQNPKLLIANSVNPI